MPSVVRNLGVVRALAAPLAAAVGATLVLCACSSTQAATSPPEPAGSTSTLPGSGRPPVTIGDKNFTEQFILGELYSLALAAQGYSVELNQNIGPTEVTVQALESGRLDLYPEYLDVSWQSSPAPWSTAERRFSSEHAAYRAAQRYARGLGLTLLDPTPFSDTEAVAVTRTYSTETGVTAIGDLRALSATLTFGGPPQFEQSPQGLPALERTYGVVPAAYTSLGIGGQYQALDHGTVQVADVNSTDGQLADGDYVLLGDPQHVFGWGNAAPVVPTSVLAREGPAFAQTVNRVTALLTTRVMRELNAAVDVSGLDPKTVAQQFLSSHGLLSATRSGS